MAALRQSTARYAECSHTRYSAVLPIAALFSAGPPSQHTSHAVFTRSDSYSLCGTLAPRNSPVPSVSPPSRSVSNPSERYDTYTKLKHIATLVSLSLYSPCTLAPSPYCPLARRLAAAAPTLFSYSQTQPPPPAPDNQRSYTLPPHPTPAPGLSAPLFSRSCISLACAVPARISRARGTHGTRVPD
ncbi:hypothetical protein B0H15DRAFT_869087 [Mycena belliarum]|uniref:Uncharacterized protein n=1 Tax=Mycena belliarum TaxID=1033014 RepID=A0AAD6XIM8_9AGAR|nr:hypothetical protein B0H15DRAFT_869087 [Mycena belliae]